MDKNDKTVKKLLTVTIGDKAYSLPVEDVVSIVFLKRRKIYEVPFDTSGRVRGIFNYKGNVIAVIHREGLVCESDRIENENLTAVILKHEDKNFALLVDKADEVTAKSSEKCLETLNAAKLYSKEDLR